MKLTFLLYWTLIGLTFLLGFGLLASLPAAAPQRLVADQVVLKVPQDYPAIQAAIDAAPEGATIRIAPGTYSENLRITKSVHLEGSGVDVTFFKPVLGFRDQDDINPVITIQSLQEMHLRLSSLTLTQPSQPLAELLGYDRFDDAVGLKIEEGADDKVSLLIDNTRWTLLSSKIGSRSRLRRLEVRESRFERNSGTWQINSSWTAMEAEIVRNLFLQELSGPTIIAKSLSFRENTIIGSAVFNNYNFMLRLAEGGRGEVVGNIVVSTGWGLTIDQSGEEATWIVRGNWFLNNDGASLYLSSSSSTDSLPRFDVLIEENKIVSGSLGIMIGIPSHLQRGAWGDIRLRRNHIAGNQVPRNPIDPSYILDVPFGHGVAILSLHREWPSMGPVKIELSENQIEFNDGWGVAINYARYGRDRDPRCAISGLEYQGKEIVPPLIAGSNNIFRNNGKGDLCPANYPWPPGFRK